MPEPKMILRLSAPHLELLRQALELATTAPTVDPESQAAFGELAELLSDRTGRDGLRCHVCGYAQDRGCAIPCSWAAPELCSHCAGAMEFLAEYFFAVRGTDAFDGVLLDSLGRAFEHAELEAARRNSESEPLIVVP